MNYLYLKNELLKTNIFIDNEYLDKYINIIINNNVDKVPYETAIHHIIPKSVCKNLGINPDVDTNLVILKHKDHILVHFYIVLCVNEPYKNKLMSALMYMRYGYIKNYKVKILNEDLNKIENELVKYSDVYQQLMSDYSECISNREKNKKIDKDVIKKRTETRIKNGTNKHSEETKLKISMSNKGKTHGSSIKWTDEQKKRYKDTIIKNRVDKNNHTGKKYINNGVDCKCIDPNDFYKYENIGYVWGRLTKPSSRLNIINSRKNSNVKLKCVELNKIFVGTHSVIEYFGSYGHIFDIINGVRKKTLGYTWEVIKDE